MEELLARIRVAIRHQLQQLPEQTADRGMLPVSRRIQRHGNRAPQKLFASLALIVPRGSVPSKPNLSCLLQ